MIGNPLLLGDEGGYQISRSVRFRASASAYLNRTPAGAGNQQIFTFSFWIKRGLLNNTSRIFSTSNLSTNDFTVQFSGDNIEIYGVNAGSVVLDLVTSAVYRDPSAWYHVVVAIDTTQATSSNRAKLYVNGSQVTAFSTATYPAQNTNLYWNSAVDSRIGIFNNGTQSKFDGYLTEINFINAQALTPSSFGETNAITGVWQPKAYTGTYGTNGFYLNFSDNSAATAATIGKDYSGNGNNWTPNNISVTAGVTYDSMVDSPTVGATSSNYCVLNPLFASQTSVASGASGTAPTISNGNQTATAAGGSVQTSAISTFGVTTGKWYCEYIATAVNGTGDLFGFIQTFNGGLTFNGYRSTGVIYNQGATTTGFATWTNGDVIGMALDCGAGTLACYKNNTLIATVTITGGVTAPMFAVIWFRDASGAGSVNFGQRPFSYTPPTGFVALNTQNLPAPTISNGANYMAATTYTGTGSSLTVSNAVNGISFKPDWVWVKRRNGPQSHQLYDVIRGVNQAVYSNLTSAEVTEANGLSAFTSSGFTVISDIGVNTSGGTYVGWNWKASNTTASNTNGSITSTVSAGATQGFSVVTYTGTGAAATVGHGLGVAPSMIIWKGRNYAIDWAVYHTSIGAGSKVYLNLTNASAADTTYMNNTAPTSSVFSIAASSWTNNSSAATYVAYCFAAVAGYSAFGSYTGNGSADGPFVFLGFRPRYVMMKNTGGAASWYILDSARNTYNLANSVLNSNTAQADTTISSIDMLSNGFKLRGTTTDINGSGTTYIYAAFAEVPFKSALGR